MTVEKTIDHLNRIEFHDLTVESFSLINQEKSVFKIVCLPFDESKSEYRKMEIEFANIISLTLPSITFESDTDLEIYSFNYRFENSYICSIEFLTGFSKPSFKIEVECETINIRD